MNIFRKASGIAIARAMTEMFSRDVYFRIALSEIARARVITKKNHNRITIFHLYFIRTKISAKAKANENTKERKFGVGSSCGVSSPNGRLFWIVESSPVVWLNVDIGEYALTTKSPINCVNKNIPNRINVIESLCFIAS